MEYITEENYRSYLEVQKSGVINMFDITSGCMIAGIDEQTWKDIQTYYLELKDKYQEVYNEVFDRNISI